MAKVIIVMNDGNVDVAVKPDYIEVEVRDYGVPDDYDPDNKTCKVDDSGDRYQVFIFPAETKPVEVDEPNTMTNFYKCADCGTEWDDEWSCACDDDCPKCGTTMTPYKSEDFE